MEYSDFLELAKNRRTIRRFKPDPVPDKYIDQIIEAARWAPSGFNTQPWEFLVVRDRQIRNELLGAFDAHKSLNAAVESTGIEQKIRQMGRPWLDEAMDFHTAPVLIILLYDTRARVGLPNMGQGDPEKVRSIFISGMACAFVYMQLAATTLGLATQWLGVMPPHTERFIKILGVPPYLEFFEMMPLGFPGYRPRPKLLRPLKKMVHFNRFEDDDMRTGAEVSDFARRTWTWTTANHRRGLDK